MSKRTAEATDPRWAAVCARDPDATFFYSVRTTGVYCRPSCAARLARRENVAFHATADDAERAGFRACKRCKPRDAKVDRAAAHVTLLCRVLEEGETIPTLDELGRRVGLSPFHAHRLFKAATGMTPRAYAVAHRKERMRQELRARRTVTEAIYSAGYASSGRFYAEADEALGMTPSAYRDGGTKERIRYAAGSSSLGHVLVAATSRGVCSVALGDDEDDLVRDLMRRFPRAEHARADARFEALVARVVALVERPERDMKLPLDIRGTAFQERVWRALSRIPAGETRTYSELAALVGAPNAVRAVAHACASNAIAVAIPCHRAVRKGGALAGYRWGIERKKALLAREAKRRP